MDGLKRLVLVVAVASLSVPLVAESAQAAPTWCKAWRVNGQTWYARHSNGFNLLFTLRMGSPPSARFGGFARFSQGDPNQGGVASQFLGGGVNSDRVGSILMNVVWTNGSSGQYNARAYDVERTRSGGLTAGLRGTAVDTSGSGAPGASWNANGQSNGIRPLFCSAGAVVH